MPEDQLKILTGLNWENINFLRQMLTSMRDTNSRSVTQALIMFLFKLRTGNSNRIISSIFGLEREQQVSDYYHQLLKGFENDILPFHFGFNAVSREDLIAIHSSYIATKLFEVENDQLMLIFDGTYIRHGKSSNNEYQRKSYSCQKKQHLCKPFTICTTDGYIVDIVGPFLATQNDASIMKIVLEYSDFKHLLHKNDIFIVDRGFRDAIQTIEEKGFILLMPAFKNNRPQLTTEESNYSRKITKVRWVVEAIHGAMSQKYKLLHHTLQNKMLSDIGLLCKIIGYLQNTFGKRLCSDEELPEEIIESINSKINVSNTLAEEVINKHWNRRKSAFQQLKISDLSDFSKLSKRDLIILFTGTYQLSQAVSYLAEIIEDNNDPHIKYLQETPNILKMEVKSHHVNRKKYRCYVEYAPHGSNYKSILRYCCDCSNGNRTVGCCSHLAAIIYYLSHARYLSRVFRPAEILSKLFDKNNIQIVINDDSEED